MFSVGSTVHVISSTGELEFSMGSSSCGWILDVGPGGSSSGGSLGSSVSSSSGTVYGGGMFICGAGCRSSFWAVSPGERVLSKITSHDMTIDFVCGS